MKPFDLSTPARELKDRFLTPDALRVAVPTLSDPELFGVIQQWFTEGIPYAFRNAPLLYESVRSWLAFRIGLLPKEITLIGSGRIGYTCKEASFGKEFGEHSDLDFTAISDELFHKCRKSFERWQRDFRWGKIKPRNYPEQRYWKDNLECLPKNITRGFLDPHRIPTRYECPALISDSLWRVEEKLRVTPSAPKVRPRGISIRVYRDWTALVKQMRINLLNTIYQL